MNFSFKFFFFFLFFPESNPIVEMIPMLTGFIESYDESLFQTNEIVQLPTSEVMMEKIVQLIRGTTYCSGEWLFTLFVLKKINYFYLNFFDFNF